MTTSIKSNDMTKEVHHPFAKLNLTDALNASVASPTGALQYDEDEAQNAPKPKEMGVRSHKRTPPTRKTKQTYSSPAKKKKKANPKIAHFDRNQRAVDDISKKAFNPVVDCVICHAVDNDLRVPHRKHDVRCPGNLKNRQGETKNEKVLRNYFNKPMENPEKEEKLTGGGTPSVQVYYAAPTMTTRRRKALAAQDPVALAQNGEASDAILSPNSSPLEVAKFLKRRVATRLQAKEAPSQHKAPPAMLALAEEIMEQVVNSKPVRLSDSLPDTARFNQAYAKFHAIFGKNNFVYTVPHINDSESPIDPNFHSLAGSQFIYMDLELAFPDSHIHCCNCNSKDLTRKRDCYSQNKTLLRIVTDSNETWCRPFKYKCNRCKHEFETNEGPFLANLPAFIRNQYPVDPRYAKKGNHCHLSKWASRLLEEEMLTHSNARQFVLKMLRRKHQFYLDRIEDYLSRPNIGGSYPDLQQVVRTYAPSDQDCRDLYLRAQDSTLNPEGMAANDRNERIIQATTIDELLAIDHTFETLKNYRLEGGKAIFTVLNEKAQICSLVIVPTQKLCEIDHMLNKMLKRKGMDFNDGKPRGLYTDTWPNNKEYWEKRLGPDTEGALGLFHYNQRVVKHLNPRHPHFYRVKDRFQRAVYKYNQDDLDALTNAFKDGHIKDKNGETYTQEALDEMRLSKNWKMNYTKYLRKEIPNGDQVDGNLNDFEAWLLDFFKTVPEDLFTSSLQKFREQLANNRKHANHIQDPEGIEMYRGVKPGKKALIQLVKWFSKRPESLIEMFHGLMRHFGNTGMRPEMADSLTLRGAAEYNLQREHKFQQMENDDGEVDCCWEHVPRYCRDQPLYSNPAFLHQVNELAKGKNMEPPFPHIRAMAPNNGEVFLSKYFKKQTERNQLQKPLDGGLCSCKECESCAIQFDTVASPVVQRENTSAGKNNSVQSVRNLSCSFQFFKCAHLLFSLKLKRMHQFPIRSKF